MTKRKILLIGLFLTLFIPLLASVCVKGDINTLISYKTNSAPTIDGTFTETEWTDAYHTSFFHEPEVNHPDDYVHIYIKNTQSKLYMLFDDLPDNTTDNEDYVDIYFDNDRESLYIGEYTTLYDSGLELDCKLFLVSITTAVSAEFV